MAKDAEVSHGELVERIARFHESLTGEEMVEIWNGLCPAQPVKYVGDSMYEWVESETK
jgi:hypothetical protein